MKLIVGLGNPGKEYLNTRHNVGYMFLDYLVNDYFSFNNKFNSFEYITSINGEKVIFIKPSTYMNLSGESVIKYINYYKLTLDDVLVIQDDLDMPLGKYKFLFNHGDGGHNGIKNIILNVGSKSFLRLKIGISKNNEINTKEYVLGKFNNDNLDILNSVFNDLKSIVLEFISKDRNFLMLKYNSK